MCGIVGAIGAADFREGASEAIEIMRSRGPDANGIWFQESSGIGLGHVRLSILDLSEEGQQPMRSRSGRYVIVFNGEIYNFRSLRERLCEENPELKFRGSSDTEVILASVEAWGIDRALEQLNGMFAFGIWDEEERELVLARDRMGEKPLYYGWGSDGKFAFASVMGAVRKFPDIIGNTIDRNALCAYMQHGYVPGPWTVFEGVRKLPPAHQLRVNPGAGPVEPTAYWTFPSGENRLSVREDLSESAAIEELDQLLKDSVTMRMESDVPLGAFLSGGIDSSVVVSAMQAVSNRPVKTFSIGFHEADYNEAEFAGKVAKHLGTDHSELYVSPQDALDVVPLLPTMYDEPFADSSQIPTYLVSQLARESVTVSLSGDGGDELFCGYSRYFDAAQRLEQLRSDKPGAIQRLFAQTSLPEFLDRGAGLTMRALRRPAWPPRFQNLASRWRVGDDGIAPELACYLPSINHWNDPNSLVLKGEPYPGLTNDFDLWPDMAPYQLQLQSVDAVTYLPDDILVKVDRASMAVSLESRVPLLDHRIVEFAWSLPHRLRVKDGKGKWVLREVLSRYVPREYFERPKMGFGVPIDSWLRAELKDWAEELLREERLKDQGLFDPGPIREAWKAHLDGHSHHYQLWNVLMFQAWLDSSLAS